MRRHLPTVNAGWGNKVSILLGDMLFTHAFHLTSTVDRRACEFIGEATNRVCAGELRQVSERGNLDLTEADYFAIIDGKTAALTECCGRLGALYAGASEEVGGAAGELRPAPGTRVPDRRRPARPHRQRGESGQDARHRSRTAEADAAGDPLPAQAPARRGRVAARRHPRRRRRARDARVDRAGEDAVAGLRSPQGRRVRTQRPSRELECLPRSECRAILESLGDWAIRREK